MTKKIVSLTVCLIMLLPLIGCWNYEGLDENTIVSGIAFDYDTYNNNYLLTCEFIDLSQGTKQGGVKSKIIESQGKSIMEAFRNARRKANNRLYIGNTQIIIVSKNIAKTKSLNDVIDWFITDHETRELINIIVSQENTAKDLLINEAIDNAIIANEVKNIVKTDQKSSASIKYVPLYKVYSIMRMPGISLTLPAFHLTTNNDKTVIESNGQAVFKNNKLIGFLNPDETKYFLFATNDIQGGILTLTATQQYPFSYALEIFDSNTDTSYSYTNDELKIKLKIQTIVALNEIEEETDLLKEKKMKQLEKMAEDMIMQNVSTIIKKVQKEYGSDIFGFGQLIYKKDNKLWKQLEPKWDKLFQSLQVEVESKVTIRDTFFLKQN